MTSSSYLEAFLSVYGWSVYALIFVVIVITGFFLYPLLRAIGNIIVEYLSGGYSGLAFLKQVLVTAVLVMVVFYLALVPVVPISYDKISVRKNCDPGPSVTKVNTRPSGGGSEGSYFTITESAVPILPYMAMSLGQRFNNVLYKQIPCAGDLTEWNKKSLSVTLENAEDSLPLRQEYDQFKNECMMPVHDLVRKIRSGHFDNGQENGKVRKWFEEKLNAAVNEKFRQGWFTARAGTSGGMVKEHEENLILYFEDSKFVHDMFFSESSPMVTEMKAELGTIPSTFRAANPVDGYNDKDGKGEGLPSCLDWWKNGGGEKKPLRDRIVEGLSVDAVMKVADRLGVAECRPDVETFEGIPIRDIPMTKHQIAACKNKIVERMKTDENGFNTRLLETFQGNTVKDSPVDGGRSAALAIMAAGAVAAGFIESKFGVDLGANLLGNVVSFYGTIWMLKILLEYLLPMVMMAIYMFWGIFMVMGEMRGSALVKGLFLLFALTIIPGLWSVVDHLDDGLFEAMYESVFSNPFNRVLLDASTGVFYFLLPFIVFNMLGIVGFGDAGGSAIQTQERARGMAGTAGTSLGRGSGGFGRWFMIGKSSPKGATPDGRPMMQFSGGQGRRGIGGLYGGLKQRWNNFRNRPK